MHTNQPQPNTTENDDQHLKLLSIFHYIMGGLTGVLACFPLIHVSLGLALMLGGLGDESGDAPPAWFGAVFAIIGGALVLTGWSLAAAMLWAGRCLALRRSYTLCFLVAGCECILMPYGTVLGVFTILVLTRDRVKAQFHAR